MENRNFDLAPRRENTREQRYETDVIHFELPDIYAHFQENVDSINAQMEVADHLVDESQLEIAETIWRSQIVLLASAVDFYMHELTKYGLCEIFDESWEVTTKYKNLMIRMEYVNIALKSCDGIEWFLEYTNNLFKEDTMISHESIKKQFNLIGIDLKEVADFAFYDSDSSEPTQEKFKERINALFKRRNAIAHQSDRAHTDAQTEEITKELVEEFLHDIKNVIEGIHQQALSK